MNEKKQEYARLMLKCLNLKEKDYLFIQSPNYLSEFIDIIKEEAKAYELKGIYVDKVDVYKKHEVLKLNNIEEVKKSPLFDKKILNDYAALDAAFLFLDSNIPDLMSDIDPELMKQSNIYQRSTQLYFRGLYETDKLNWCIVGVPNEEWAKSVFKSDYAMDELWDAIFDVCLVDGDGTSYEKWINKFNKMKSRTDKLNNYKFDHLCYKNTKGTDLTIYLPDGHIWASGMNEKNNIVNMPTEEVFTSPYYIKTEGIVYSSKPLLYNNAIIDEFWIKFKNGKAVEFDAKIGREYLEKIINFDDYSAYLGECALVSYDSPISNTGIIFQETLYDENASCHLAFGASFNECLKDSGDKREDELRSMGINDSKTHVDFMIGTADLEIIGVTKDNNEVKIFENGNFII